MMISGGCGGGHHPLFLRVVLAIRPNLETPLGEKSL